MNYYDISRSKLQSFTRDELLEALIKFMPSHKETFSKWPRTHMINFIVPLKPSIRMQMIYGWEGLARKEQGVV